MSQPAAGAKDQPPGRPADIAAATGDVDPWQLAGMPGGVRLANYLTADKTASQYRLIVDVLLDQQQHSLTGVSFDELTALVRTRLVETTDAETTDRLLSNFALGERMAQLAAWQVVDTWDERLTGNVNWQRNASRYQLTALAAQFHRGVRRLGQDGTGALAATFAPGILRTHLDAMVAALGTDPGAVVEAWAVVKPTLDGMADAAAGWQARLAGALAGPADPVKVAALQDTLRRYVDMWGAGVDSHSAALTAAATALLRADPSGWRGVALHSAGAEAGEAVLEETADAYQDTLRTVLSWFGGTDNQARRLRRQMRDAIAPMVRGQRTLAAVGGHVSRRAELLTLATALESSSDDEAAWALWCTSTGLFSARHLPLSSPQPAGAPGAVSFWTADPTLVEARLRAQGPRSQTGRPARIADRSAGRAAARAGAAANRRVAAAARHAILARSGLYLSAWHDVNAVQLEVLLRMLADLAAADSDLGNVRTARTGDGLWQLRSDPPAAGRPAAVVHTTAGRLAHPDIRLTITSTEMADQTPAGRQ